MEFFDDCYLERHYSNQSTFRDVGNAYLRRIRQLRVAGKADILWIEKEALPWLPWMIERALLQRGAPIVADYDDALFHQYDQNPSVMIRHLLGRKIDDVMAASAVVTAGNEYLAERARQAGARRVEMLPTVIDIHRYPIVPRTHQAANPKIGWIGTPSTWVEYMLKLMPLLLTLASDYAARVVAVGAGQNLDPHPLFDSLPWSEQTEVEQIQDMDIGIMPLTDTPWARGKCGYKLIQYMACGLPVVASPVGVNTEIVEHGVNGFLASSEAEWRLALETLLSDGELRRRMGAAGRQKVEEKYSVQVHGPRVAALLSEIARAGRA